MPRPDEKRGLTKRNLINSYVVSFTAQNDNDILKTLFTMVHLLLNHPNIDIHKNLN